MESITRVSPEVFQEAFGESMETVLTEPIEVLVGRIAQRAHIPDICVEAQERNTVADAYLLDVMLTALDCRALLQKSWLLVGYMAEHSLLTSSNAILLAAVYLNKPTSHEFTHCIPSKNDTLNLVVLELEYEERATRLEMFRALRDPFVVSHYIRETWLIDWYSVFEFVRSLPDNDASLVLDAAQERIEADTCQSPFEALALNDVEWSQEGYSLLAQYAFASTKYYAEKCVDERIRSLATFLRHRPEELSPAVCIDVIGPAVARLPYPILWEVLFDSRLTKRERMLALEHHRSVRARIIRLFNVFISPKRRERVLA